MKQTRLLLFFLTLFLFETLSAQDIHFTLYNMSPLTLNPAQSGAFYGTARIGGIYRDQWRSISNFDGYQTPSFHIDAPIFRGFGDNDWVGVGGMLFSDKAGACILRTTASMLSAAYHLALGRNANTVLTLGLQGGSVQRRIDLQSLDLRFEDEIDEQFGGGGVGIGNGADRTGNGKKSYIDFSGGLMLRTELTEGARLELGVAVGHVLTPEYNLLSKGTDDAKSRPMTTTAHGQFQYDLTDQWRITPTFLFQTTQGISETMLQVWGGYLINPEKAIRINFGTGYRLNDALPVLVGIDVEDLRVALAYDINTSSLNQATNSVGGFEIAATYIFKIFKEPDVEPAILCPQF
jgi:type IX secretion system PorP/SprF family membrane protein